MTRAERRLSCLWPNLGKRSFLVSTTLQTYEHYQKAGKEKLAELPSLTKAPILAFPYSRDMGICSMEE